MASDADLLDQVLAAPGDHGLLDQVLAPASASGMAVNMVAPVGGEFGDLAGQDWAQGAPADLTARAPIAKIGDAVVQGWQDTPSILTPKAQAAVDRYGGVVGQTLVNPALKLIGAVPAAGNAVMQGVAETVNQITGDPRAGRDAMVLMQVAPVAHIGTGVPSVEVPRSAPDAPRPRFMNELYAPDVSELDTGNAIRTLIQHDIAENPLAAPGRGTANQSLMPPDNQLLSIGRPAPPIGMPANTPLPPVEAPGSRSVGAAASRDLTAPELLAERTRGQAQTDFEKSVMQTAEERAGPGGEDHTVYVPGAVRTEAARKFSVENAVNEKTSRDTDPVFAGQIGKIEQDSRGVVDDTYKNMSGDQRAVELAHEARDEATPDALNLFTSQKPVDAAPFVQWIDDQLAGPAGKRSAVASVLKDVRAKLFDKDGNPETMPDMLYGARQNITDKLKSKGTDTEASNARLAKKILSDGLDRLDPIIAAGAPGFAEYLPRFAELSKPIEQMEFLQSKLLGPGKITDASGHVTFGGIQKLLEKIAVDRKAGGVNPAKSLTDDQLQGLIDIRNELAANHYRDRLAATKGSDTVQKANAARRLMGGAAAVGADAATQAALLYTTGGVGNAIYQYGLKPAYKAHKTRQAEAAAADLKSRLLNTTPRNQLLE